MQWSSLWVVITFLLRAIERKLRNFDMMDYFIEQEAAYIEAALESAKGGVNSLASMADFNYDNATLIRYMRMQYKAASGNDDDAADDIQDSIDDFEKFLNHITGIKKEWQDMLGRGVIPIFEIELTDGEHLDVDLGIVGNGIYFTFDQDGLPAYFDGDIISGGDGVYVLPFDEYMTLQDMLELIADNIREGYIAPNGLFDSRAN